jgi:hypothetical protein
MVITVRDRCHHWESNGFAICRGDLVDTFLWNPAISPSDSIHLSAMFRLPSSRCRRPSASFLRPPRSHCHEFCHPISQRTVALSSRRSTTRTRFSVSFDLSHFVFFDKVHTIGRWAGAYRFPRRPAPYHAPLPCPAHASLPSSSCPRPTRRKSPTA